MATDSPRFRFVSYRNYARVFVSTAVIYCIPQFDRGQEQDNNSEALLQSEANGLAIDVVYGDMYYTRVR